MRHKTPVGVLNGNWRAGDYFLYRQAVEAGKRGMPTAEEIQRMTTKKKLRASYWTQRLSNAIGALRNADPTGWEAWYDSDANVPADVTDRECALLLEARVKELTGAYTQPKACLRREIFIWQDEIGPYVYCKEIGKRTLYFQSFDSMQEAEEFVTSLPYKNCGYGVVLDLLPATALVEA